MIIRRGALSGITMRGGLVAVARFAVDWSRVDTIVTPGDTDEQTIDDAVFEVTTPATVDHEAQAIIRPTHPDADVSQITWSVSDESIATIDATGRVTRVSDGYIRIIATDQHGAVARSGLVHIYRETVVEPKTFVRWVEGSLAKAAADAVDSRIAEADPQTDMAIFTTQDHANGIYVRNPNCWAADLDLTGISPWNSRSGALRAGVAISPRDVLVSEHYPLQVDNTIRFVAADNTVVTRTIAAVKNVGPANSSDGNATDFQVCTLDEDLPAGIKHYTVLPAEWADFIRNLDVGLPTLGLDQEEKALVQDLYTLGTVAAHRAPSDSQRLAFYESKITGDSGNPSMLILDDEPVLVTLWTLGGAGIGPNIAGLHDLINEAMTANGSPYQLTVADLSAWPNFAFRDVILSYNPVAYWPFDGDYNDVVGGLTATPVNDPSFAAGAVPNSSGSLSTPSTARADVAHNDALNIGTGDDFCVSLWVRFLDPPGGSTAYVIFKRSNGSHTAANPGWAMYVTPNGSSAVVSVTDGEHRAYGTLSGATSWLVDGNWHHVLFGIDRSANRILMWVDGVPRINSAGADDGLAAIDSLVNAHDLVMCQVSAVIGIDEVAIYKTAPTLAMAQAIYNAGGHLPGRNMLLNTEDFTSGYWSKLAGLTVVGDYAMAPDGTMTADLLVGSQAGSRVGRSGNVFEEGETISASVYIKYVDQDIVHFRVWSGDATPNDLMRVQYRFSTSSFSLDAGSGTNRVVAAEDAGNGWVRIMMTSVVHSAADYWIMLYSSVGSGDAIGNTLAWGIQLEKGPVTPYEPRGAA